MTHEQTPFFGALGERLAKLPQSKGIAAAQISAYARARAITLPAAVQAFLRIAGADYDFLFGGGTRATFASLAGIAEEAAEILTECGGAIDRPFLPLLTYSGAMFLFVYLDDGDDPPVYRFECESTGAISGDLPPGFVRTDAAFSTMLEALVAEREAFNAR
jgi:hypothetical protein